MGQGSGFDAVLQSARLSLDIGDVEQARALVHEVLADAQASGDRLVQARALASLGDIERMVSRFRRAHDHAQRAAMLFKELDDVVGESAALATLAHCAASLGRNEEAVEAALLGVRLGASLPVGAQTVLAWNYLGIAQFWSRDFERADRSFERSVQAAAECVPPLPPAQPRQNQAMSECVRAACVRYDTGVLPDLQRLNEVVAICRALALVGRNGSIVTGGQVTGHAVLEFLSSLTACWNGDLAGARAFLDAALEWRDRYRATTWLHVVENWVRCEIARAEGDLHGAERLAAMMVDSANRVDHEQLACLGHLILTGLYEAQGRLAEAMAEMRRLRVREHKIRTENLESRERVVEWQLEVRSGERARRALERSSRRLERLSLEDTLTGLPNRRHFERMLAQTLERAGDALPGACCVALFDVDRFKEVNDRYSHLVGDQVLQRIAELLRRMAHVDDFAARLAGDEFVLLLPATGEVEANTRCRQVADAIAAADWATIRPGLCVTVSFGVAQAGPGEMPAAVLHRSDTAMYAAKHRKLTPRGLGEPVV
jgi:diguanylate cyclase (GGDEF)-like protein